MTVGEAPAPDRSKRYYITRRGSQGDITFSLVEGVPDPQDPTNRKKDGRTGPVLIEAHETVFWQEVRAAGFTWRDTGAFTPRFWEYRGRGEVVTKDL